MADSRSVLKVRMRAAASGGDANAALPRLLVASSGVPPRSEVLSAGATSRIKRLTVAGEGTARITALEKICTSR